MEKKQCEMCDGTGIVTLETLNPEMSSSTQYTRKCDCQIK